MIQVIIRALNILDYVAQHGREPVKLINIAEHVKISQPTCANIIKTLVAKNYLENVSRNEGYRLGSGAFHLTGNLSYNQNLISAAKEIMERLTTSVNETSLLGAIRNNKRHILCLVQGNQDLLVRANNEVDAYPTASGRLLLAYMPDKEFESFFQAVGMPQPEQWPGITSKEALIKALKKIRKEGLVEILTVKHIVGLAVPIYKSDKVIAALSIFLPESRCISGYKKRLIEDLKKAASELNKKIETA